MEIFISICCDRHIDETVRVFSTLEKAVEFCKDFVGKDEDTFNEEELTPSMEKDNWLYYGVYGTDGDSVRVEKSQLDPQEKEE